MRVVLGSGGGGGDELGRKAGVELGETSKPFTMHSSMRGKNVVVDGRKVSGTGMALGCAPVEQASRGAVVSGFLCGETERSCGQLHGALRSCRLKWTDCKATNY